MLLLKYQEIQVEKTLCDIAKPADLTLIAAEAWNRKYNSAYRQILGVFEKFGISDY